MIAFSYEDEDGGRRASEAMTDRIRLSLKRGRRSKVDLKAAPPACTYKAHAFGLLDDGRAYWADAAGNVHHLTNPRRLAFEKARELLEAMRARGVLRRWTVSGEAHKKNRRGFVPSRPSSRLAMKVLTFVSKPRTPMPPTKKAAFMSIPNPPPGSKPAKGVGVLIKTLIAKLEKNYAAGGCSAEDYAKARAGLDRWLKDAGGV